MIDNKLIKAIEAVHNNTASLSEFGSACSNFITINEINEVQSLLNYSTKYQPGNIVRHISDNGTKYIVISSGWMNDINNITQVWYFVSCEGMRTFYPEYELIKGE